MKLSSLTTSFFLFTSLAASLQAQSTTVGTPHEENPRQIIESREKLQREQERLTRSDTGVQQVVQTKKSKIGGFVGASASYFYRHNALSVNEPIGTIVHSDVLSYSGYAALSYGPFKAGEGIFTPYVGVMHTSFEHQESLVEFADYISQSAYLLGEYKTPSGWSVTPTFTYSRNINRTEDTVDYEEWVPSVDISKVYSLSQSAMLKMSVGSAFHYTVIDDLGGAGGRESDQLNNWSNSAGMNLYYDFYGVLLDGYVQVIRKDYKQGLNSDRDDLYKIGGGSISYGYGIFRASLFATFTSRDSNTATNEFKNWDAGLNLSATYGF